jgi:transcriptional regulator with XRE-family HTH domain
MDRYDRRGSDPVDLQVGRRIRRRRRELRLSQATLGAALGVSAQQIRRFERGTSATAPGYLLRLADRLAVSVEFFFADATVVLAADGDGAKPAEQGAEMTELIHSFRRIQHDGIRRDLFLLVKQAARRSTLRQPRT